MPRPAVTLTRGLPVGWTAERIRGLSGDRSAVPLGLGLAGAVRGL